MVAVLKKSTNILKGKSTIKNFKYGKLKCKLIVRKPKNAKF